MYLKKTGVLTTNEQGEIQGCNIKIRLKIEKRNEEMCKKRAPLPIWLYNFTVKEGIEFVCVCVLVLL